MQSRSRPPPTLAATTLQRTVKCSDPINRMTRAGYDQAQHGQRCYDSERNEQCIGGERLFAAISCYCYRNRTAIPATRYFRICKVDPAGCSSANLSGVMSGGFMCISTSVSVTS